VIGTLKPLAPVPWSIERASPSVAVMRPGPLVVPVWAGVPARSAVICTSLEFSFAFERALLTPAASLRLLNDSPGAVHFADGHVEQVGRVLRGVIDVYAQIVTPHAGILHRRSANHASRTKRHGEYPCLIISRTC
jgi:hypothetical protein